MSTDIHAEIKALRAELEATEAALAAAQARVTPILENHPSGVAIASATGELSTNAAGAQLLGGVQSNEGTEAWSKQYGLFLPDQKTLFPPENLPLVRAMTRGETVDGERIWARTAAHPDGLWLSVSAQPIPGGGAAAVFRDVTRDLTLRNELEDRTEALAARARQNEQLIERLRLSLDDLSTPVIEIWDEVLAVPLIGLLDTQRSARMTERVLDEIARVGARALIVDLTGVEIVDTSTADRLLKLASAVRLLGADCVVCGIQPAVAQTLVALDVEFEGLVARHNLEHALAYCVQRVRARAQGAPHRGA
jgi:rsbT co-antagonist protein RsbR